jgi:hypothetical protein
MKLKKILAIFSTIVVTIAIMLVSGPAAYGQEANPSSVVTFQEEKEDGRIVSARSYADTHGVTLDEALLRFSLQDKFRYLMPLLMEKEAETYAGMYLVDSPEFQIVALFTRDGETTLGKYIPDELKNESSVIRVKRVNVSLRDLEKTQIELKAMFDSMGLRTGGYINERANCVVVKVEHNDKQKFDMAIQSGAVTLPVYVKVVSNEELYKAETDLIGGLTLTYGDDATTGFGVRRNSDGQMGIITAGHVANSWLIYWDPFPRILEYISEAYSGPYDVQFNINNSLTVKNKILIGPSTTRDITARTNRWSMYIGEDVEKYGSTTHYTKGEIYSKNEYSDVPGSTDTYIGVEPTLGYPDLSEPGDSGCPWYVGNTAYGVHSAGAAGGYACFTAADYCESGLGVSILTSP